MDVGEPETIHETIVHPIKDPVERDNPKEVPKEPAIPQPEREPVPA